MWRDRPHFRHELVGAANSHTIILEERVRDRTVAKRFCGPTKHVRIKLSGFFRIACAKLAPAWPSSALPKLRILCCWLACQTAKTAPVGSLITAIRPCGSYIEWSINDGRAFGFRFFNLLICVRNCDVSQPMRWNSLRQPCRASTCKAHRHLCRRVSASCTPCLGPIGLS